MDKASKEPRMSKILTDEELREMEERLYVNGGARLIQSHRALQEELSEARDAFRKLNLQALENHNRMTKERDSLREKLAIAEEALTFIGANMEDTQDLRYCHAAREALAQLRKDAP